MPELPNGHEEGTYLAHDLGGTNFRVMLMEMKAGRITREEVSYYTVQEETRLGPGIQNFDGQVDSVIIKYFSIAIVT